MKVSPKTLDSRLMDYIDTLEDLLWETAPDVTEHLDRIAFSYQILESTKVSSIPENPEP